MANDNQNNQDPKSSLRDQVTGSLNGRNDGDQPDSSEKMIGHPNLHLMNHKKQRAAQHKHVQVLELLEDVGKTRQHRQSKSQPRLKQTKSQQIQKNKHVKRRSFSRSYRVNCSFCISFNDGNLWVYFL